MKMSFKEYVSEHWSTLLISALFFLMLSVVAVGPLVYKVMAELSSKEARAVQKKNDAINRAIVKGDYEYWRSLVEDDKLKAEITSVNFDTFAQAYILLEQGEVEAANILKKQADLKQTYQVAVVKSVIINRAIAKRDYEAWRKVVGSGYSPEVTHKNFYKYADILEKANSGLLNRSTKLQVNMGTKQNLTTYSSSH